MSTVEEVRIAKRKLETTIRRELERFEQTHLVAVSYLGLDRHEIKDVCGDKVSVFEVRVEVQI